MSSLGGTAPSERPERSRNAKAQARHRAKRKAYIDQLEQTVTKLQSQMGLSPDQISVLPPPMMKIRELEQENGRLLKENEELRRMLQEQAGGRPLDLSRRPLSNDTRNGERDYKRRKPDMDDHPYLSHASSMNDLRPPPPLTIPNGSSYGHVSSHNPTASGTALYGMNGGGGGGTHFQLPNTPSGSSSTSSPPFSPDMHSATHSPSNNRNGSHYSSVKVEDDSYTHSHSNSYSSTLPPFNHYSSGQADHGLDSWHSYSSERIMHR